MIPILFGITIVIFLMLRLVPGDPAVIMLGNRATDENVAQLRGVLGLDEPLPVQYVLYMKNLFQGDLGESYSYRQPVKSIVLERIPVTLLLSVFAAILALIITIPLSILAAYKQNRVPDHFIRLFLLIGLAMPGFWLGLNLLLLFSVKYHIFPAGGYGVGFADHIRHLFLPALTIAITMSAVLVRSLRTNLIDTLSSDHVRTARAKGLRGRDVLVWHVLRNSSVSTVTILGIYMSVLIGGTVIIETVFAIPGMGQLLIRSIFGRDYPVVQAIALIYAILVIVTNLLVDLTYAVLDPRVRLE